MGSRILLVNPPIYDFAAYDFWLKPYGLLSVAGQVRGQADFFFFDYLDRLHPFAANQPDLRPDEWGRGRFPSERIESPAPVRDIPRFFHRFGLPRALFQDRLREQGPFDCALIATVMTYWYPGVREVVEDIRRVWPETRIVLGGNYVTLCTEHARGLGADLIVIGSDLQPLWERLHLTPDPRRPALWEVYDALRVGVLKLSDGCPFQCSYCSVPKVHGRFLARPRERSLAEIELLARRGVEDVAFYDDALLFDARNVLMPFLADVIRRGIRLNLHTPNALNARFLSAELVELMVRAGFKTFYLGLESCARRWQQDTGGKVFAEEFAEAVRHLQAAGVAGQNVTAYQILGHPDSDVQELEKAMRFGHSLGIRGMLADFSPIPGTPDGDACGRWVDMNEPLMHNKTAFPILRLGFAEVNRLKDLQRALNRTLEAHPAD